VYAVSSAYVCVGMSLCIAKPVNSLLITNQDLLLQSRRAQSGPSGGLTRRPKSPPRWPPEKPLSVARSAPAAVASTCLEIGRAKHGSPAPPHRLRRQGIDPILFVQSNMLDANELLAINKDLQSNRAMLYVCRKGEVGGRRSAPAGTVAGNRKKHPEQSEDSPPDQQAVA
jgi:hypothetical protein